MTPSSLREIIHVMKELLDYERVLWALAHELYERNKVLGAPLWALATPAVKANFRTKADHCLNGWGYENVGGTLSTRAYPIDVYHRATHDAQDTYLKGLIKEYEEEPPTTQRVSHRKTNYIDAVEALARYAYGCSTALSDPTWETIAEHDKAAYLSIVKTLLEARGFVPISGQLQLSEGNGPIFTAISHVLRDGFALNRVEALAHNDTTAFAKYDVRETTDTVHEAILKAGEKGLFSTYSFSDALYKLAGHNGSSLPPCVVHTILEGREDVEFEPPLHYRVRGVTAKRPTNMLLDEFTPEEKVATASKMWNDSKLSDNGAAQMGVTEAQQGVTEQYKKGIDLKAGRERLEQRKLRDAATSDTVSSDPYPDGNYERRRDVTPDASPYPVNEDGAEDYAAVQANASVLQDATRVLGRDLYEKTVAGCTNPTPWRDLLPIHQSYYNEQTRSLPLDLVELRKIYNKQQEADAKIGKEVKPAPTFVTVASIAATPKEEVKPDPTFVSRFSLRPSDQIVQNVLDVNGQPLEGIVGASPNLPNRNTAAQDYALLAETAYAVLRDNTPFEPWSELKEHDKTVLTNAAKGAWLEQDKTRHTHPAAIYLCEVVAVLRKTALSGKMTLHELLTTDNMRAVRGETVFSVHVPSPKKDLILPEVVALAWYAHETSRLDDNTVLPWAKLDWRDQMVKMYAARDYFVRNKRDASQSEVFYAALDVVPRNAVTYLCVAYHELRNTITDRYTLRFLFNK